MYEVTYEDLAKMIGFRMIAIIGAMGQLGLTTLPHFVNNHIEPWREDSPTLRDYERWLKWALAPKDSEERHHLYPTDLVRVCQEGLHILWGGEE
jgi:hypothetical protein